MAAGVPPPPINSPAGSYYWIEWYTGLTNFLNGTNIPWSNLNFSGSNIFDIQTRHHNTLTNIQGGNAGGDSAGTGNAYHLMGYGYTDATVSSIKVPSGWLVTHTGTGVYTITHNLGLTAPNYMTGATTNSSAGVVTYVDNTNANAIVIHVGSPGSLTTPVDAPVSFWIGII